MTDNNQAVRFFATFSVYGATSALKLATKGCTRITLSDEFPEGSVVEVGKAGVRHAFNADGVEVFTQRQLATAILLTAGREMDFIPAHTGVAADGRTYEYRDEYQLTAELSAPLSSFITDIVTLPQSQPGFAAAHAATVDFDKLSKSVMGWVRVAVAQSALPTSLIPGTKTAARNQNARALASSL